MPALTRRRRPGRRLTPAAAAPHAPRRRSPAPRSSRHRPSEPTAPEQIGQRRRRPPTGAAELDHPGDRRAQRQRVHCRIARSYAAWAWSRCAAPSAPTACRPATPRCTWASARADGAGGRPVLPLGRRRPGPAARPVVRVGDLAGRGPGGGERLVGRPVGAALRRRPGSPVPCPARPAGRRERGRRAFARRAAGRRRVDHRETCPRVTAAPAGTRRRPACRRRVS